MPMKVQYSLPGLVPRPIAPAPAEMQPGESFQSRLETLRSASAPDWREVLQLGLRPAGAQHIGPPPRPVDLELRDGIEQRGYWRRMLEARVRAFENSGGSAATSREEAGAVHKMLSLLMAMQQAADSVVARHLSETQR
ncbi:MAG TPA: hypothetical protein VN428_02210 [Bryobacteraceae bacterium]|nr:hypothetical protein [Bryobacteraceae bacterium]